MARASEEKHAELEACGARIARGWKNSAISSRSRMKCVMQGFGIGAEGCSRCGSTLHPIDESVSEMLDWIPAPLRVIVGGLATPALLSHVLISKYCDHLPFYRQSQMFAR
jgi:transposase